MNPHEWFTVIGSIIFVTLLLLVYSSFPLAIPWSLILTLAKIRSYTHAVTRDYIHIEYHVDSGDFVKCWSFTLKLYCRYLYTRPCMINHIWGLKQLWLQVNWHAWFHLHWLRWPVRNGEGAKNSKWKCMSPAGFEPTPRQSTTGKSERLRPLGHEGLMVISALMSNRIMGYKF